MNTLNTLEKIELKTDFLADCSGKVTEETVREALEHFSAESYRGKHVLIRGCAPTWAVMQLQHRLEGAARHLSFVLFDGREISIW